MPVIKQNRFPWLKKSGQIVTDYVGHVLFLLAIFELSGNAKPTSISTFFFFFFFFFF